MNSSKTLPRTDKLSSLHHPVPQFSGVPGIDRNPRACARFASTHGPGERLRRPERVEYATSYPSPIWLGPWIFAAACECWGANEIRSIWTWLRPEESRAEPSRPFNSVDRRGRKCEVDAPQTQLDGREMPPL